MGWEDRDYYRDRSSGGAAAWFRWLLMGRVSLFRVWGIHVQVMVFLLAWTVISVILGALGGLAPQNILVPAILVFIIVLLHEFGHCFAARWVGGEADEIVMHPLGGLALAHPPGRPLPTFITVAAGPMVNLIICLLAGGYVMAMHSLDGSMFSLGGPYRALWSGWLDSVPWAMWIFSVSWMLFLFNMLPIFPLDGGQMLQSILWPIIGYYRSMLFSCTAGMIACGAGVLYAIATRNVMIGLLAAYGIYFNYRFRAQLVAAGPLDVQDMDLGGLLYQPQQGFGASFAGGSGYSDESSARSRARSEKRAAAQARQIRAEDAKIEAILEKVSAHGMHSLNWLEKRALRKATERQKQRETEGRGGRRR